MSPSEDGRTTPPEPPPSAPAAPAAAPAEIAEFRERLFQVTPRSWLVPALVAANVAVFVAMVASGVSFMAPSSEILVRWGANYGPRTLNGEWWRLLSHMFLHAGVLHVGFNMLVLWSVGRFVERLYGQIELALVYLVAGLAGGLVSVGVHPDVPSVGASGAVFGVYGALGAFLLMQRRSLPLPVIEGLKKSAVSFLGYNLVYGFLLPNVDVSAHVGGLAGGALAGALLARPIVVGRPRAYGRILAALALAVALVASTRLLPAPVDMQARFAQFSAEEKRILDVYKGLVSDLDGKKSESEVGTAIEQQVLPPWKALRASMAAPGRASAAQRKLLAQFDEYMAARQDGWEWMVIGMHATEPSRRQSAAQHIKESDARVEAALKALNDKKR